jgi:hypothetical protein
MAGIAGRAGLGMGIRHLLALSCAAFACAACEYAPDMLDRTVAYNRAVANSTNEVLLLNIVRASQRSPTYYTRLEGDSSSLGVTPSSSLSLPLSNGRSFETDANSLASGAFSGGATKAVTSLAALTSGLSLGASESNLLSLQTLDDQKYQNGMMTPIPLKDIQAFQDTGLQRDLLFLMFLNSIQVSKTLIDPIDKAVAARCTDVVNSGSQTGGAISSVQQICRYIGRNPYGPLFKNAANAFSLATCRDAGGATPDPAPGTMVRFDNDPAREGRPSDPHPEVCFQILLQDLLVLGLSVGSAQDIPAELVDTVPYAVAQDPSFRAQMFQQNFFLRDTSTNFTAVCKKKSQDVGLTLLFADSEKTQADLAAQANPATKASVKLTEQENLMKALGVTGKAKTDPNDKKAADKSAPVPPPSDPTAACQQKKPGSPESTDDGLGAPTSDDADSGSLDKSNLNKPVKLTSDKMAFTTRSFEGMVYYLGEVARYQEDTSGDPISYPRILGRNPAVAGDGYYEYLFYASTRVADSDRAVSVRDDSAVSYAIPKSCMSMPNSSSVSTVSAGPQINVPCSITYPDNESVPVLNLINQVWGLQKEANAGPSSPLVVVSPQ